MFFFIVDISGYTQFMLRTKLDYSHGKVLIIQLIKALVNVVRLPMEIAKLEGDAIFFIIKSENITDSPDQLTQKIIHFFQVFAIELENIKSSKTCTCGACSHLDQLNVKIIGHYGSASIEKIGDFMEITGVDAIIVHRLLKNTVPAHCYLLLTDAAFHKLSLPKSAVLQHREEKYSDIGAISTTVYFPEYVPSPSKKQSFFIKALKFIWLEIRGLLMRFKKVSFSNFPKGDHRV